MMRISPLRHRLDVAGALAICNRIARQHGTSIEIVDSGVRYARVASARHEMIAVVVDTLALTLHEGANLFGVDHSTVLHALQRRDYERRIEHPEWFAHEKERAPTRYERRLFRARRAAAAA